MGHSGIIIAPNNSKIDDEIFFEGPLLTEVRFGCCTGYLQQRGIELGAPPGKILAATRPVVETERTARRAFVGL